ncbi:hypothetical protein CPB83DRAFT_891282 [Crepidotus variabilis]|uniref:Thioredoxin domain-containing protein n=1 Tax=Crepidotus variabilis TaxID=179855 RepID=A0A9P6EN71_9AGAR|nr:hypothetical protein CPB83DRAFT_891282 [Crepidotus variabilis]
MPLHTADGSITHSALATVPERFLVFYSSEVDGEMWCPDCRKVDTLVKDTFSQSGPEGLILPFNGDICRWRKPGNPYRTEPWSVSNVPTIIKLQDGKEVSRLDDDTKIVKELSSFVKT